MTRIFSIHKGANAIYVTDNGLKERKTPSLPSPEYKSWTDVKEYFVKLGATDEALRANIRETPVVPLINEQGEKEKGCAGVNRRGVVNARVTQERFSEPS
jgi:hypothetical protein